MRLSTPTVSTTRVSPSQRPYDSPAKLMSGSLVWGRPSVGIQRTLWGDSVKIHRTPGCESNWIGPCAVVWMVIEVGVPPAAQTPWGIGDRVAFDPGLKTGFSAGGFPMNR